MNKFNLTAKARELSKKAATESSGRAAETVFGGHEKQLRQTLIALRAGTVMAEHNDPGEATLIVITGRLWLVTATDRWFAPQFGHLIIPDTRVSIEAETDTAFLLTVVKSHR